jgi:lipopolysaccharide/colanic/teichoic acid biosynthesis glycosyltransferase
MLFWCIADSMAGGRASTKGCGVMLKRFIDLSSSVFGVILLLPLFLIVSIAIKSETSGPVFFRQMRVGLHGSRFRIFKFRTMVSDAESSGKKLTVGGDSRITKVGLFLRRHKIDELPQLFNVVTGDMSLVGPRPEIPEFVDRFADEYREILEYRPGITGRTTLLFRREEELLSITDNPTEFYLQYILPYKIRSYQRFLVRSNVVRDMATIFDTLFNRGKVLEPTAFHNGLRFQVAVEKNAALSNLRIDSRRRKTVA